MKCEQIEEATKIDEAMHTSNAESIIVDDIPVETSTVVSTELETGASAEGKVHGTHHRPVHYD